MINKTHTKENTMKLEVKYINIEGQDKPVKLTIGGYREPKKSEKTFTLFKYSAYNQGRRQHMNRGTSTLPSRGQFFK